jgi:hypothetical protein
MRAPEQEQAATDETLIKHGKENPVYCFRVESVFHPWPIGWTRILAKAALSFAKDSTEWRRFAAL